MRRFVFAVIFMIIGSAPVLADVRIVSSLGGSVGSYLLFSGETIGRTGNHRRAMPFGLHAGVEYDSP